MHILTLLLALLCVVTAPARAATDVLTNNYDAARSGATLTERTLDITNVRAERFGRVGRIAVDAPVLGQPLLVSGLDMPGGMRNVLFLTTANNSVVAIDADDFTAKPLWQRQFTQLPGGAPAASIGIASTPVIDKPAHALYVVAGFQDDKRYHYVLHALDLRDGRDARSGPVAVAGAVRVEDRRIEFLPTLKRPASQRPGLALAQDKVIVAFGGDLFEGWVFAYDKRDLRKPPAAFCTTCVSKVAAISKVDYGDEQCVQVGPGGGIWQSGRAPAVDANGHVWFFTGNKQHVVKAGCRVPAGKNACSTCKGAEGCLCEGSRSSKVCGGPDACIANRTSDGGQFDLNEALVGLDPKDLRVVGWLRPDNWNADSDDGLERNDLDLGGSGPLLLPGGRRLTGGGKQGVMYLLDIDLGAKACAAAAASNCIAKRPLQSFAIAPPPPAPNSYYRHVLGGPVLWAPGAGDARLYVWREHDVLRSYRIGASGFTGCVTADAAPTASHRCDADALGDEVVDQHPGAFLTLSANGADPRSAIVWASAYRVSRGPGRLLAYAAQPKGGALAKLWDSDACEEDAIEAGGDFVPPMVANGRVYVATGGNTVDVFGLIPDKVCTPVARPEAIGPIMQ